jgi:hypothetical protein
MNEAILINEWDSDSFHKKVLDLEAKGYAARRESYRITPEMDPETGEIVHLYCVEMGPAEGETDA